MTAPICTLHHHIGTESPFERGLGVTTSREAFEAQIDRLARDHDVVDLGTLLSGRWPRRPLLLTFDDVFRSSGDAIREVLAPRGLPSVLFVNPALLAPGAADGREAARAPVALDAALAWAAGEAGVERVCAALGLPAAESLHALVTGHMARLDPDARDRARDRVLEAFGPAPLGTRAPPLAEGELQGLVAAGAEIGNHTARHVHGRALEGADLEAEIAAPAGRIEALTGRRPRSFSVPYGHEADLTPAVLSAARRSGHEAVFLVHARSNRRRPAPDVWYRTSLRDEAPGALRAHLRWKPALRSLRHSAASRGAAGGARA